MSFDSMTDVILEQVRRRIRQEGIDLHEAAALIGIGASALSRHLGGEYVRSDSLAKYRLWLEGGVRKARPMFSNTKELFQLELDEPKLTPESLQVGAVPMRSRNVVDLFCGCGGMSLGFERFNGGGIYRIAMALDIEDPMVRVFNDNHPSPSGEVLIARQADISDFMSESEIQAYYLDHLARSTGDAVLASELRGIGHGGVPGLRKSLRDIDTRFLANLVDIRRESGYADGLKQMGGGVLGQTSIAGFHNATKLPSPGTAYPRVGPLIWHMDGDLSEEVSALTLIADEKLARSCKARARKLWDAEVEKLSVRGEGSGRGQLASAAERIQRFRQFLEIPAMQRIRKLWIEWRAEREAVRTAFFDDTGVQGRLRDVYENGRQVSVLLGGPPCQGFSRIGRGKIRSLREQSVHVHEDEDSVDSRNQLMHQYVLFVAALAPEVFLFENVRHFQAVVKSDGIEFDAADILAEAIEAVSQRGLGYKVARRIVIASQHAVPQSRERFVMAGIRKDADELLCDVDAAEWCVALSRRDSVSLQTALEGLPAPDYDSQSKRIVSRSVESRLGASREQDPSAEDVFRQWVFRGDAIDAHIARPPRPDDAAFFALMGPGKRWMDYRCEDASTLGRLATVFEKLQEALSNSPELVKKVGVSVDEISQLAGIMDGSLSLRLLLESIPPQPGELQHHLLAENYLRKREGAHGDWLSRMDPASPSKTIVSHMAKDTYAYVHPFLPRTLSVREAARVQSFPDDYRFGAVGLVDGFKVVGNAVPPLLSLQFAERVAAVLSCVDKAQQPAQMPDVGRQNLAVP
ncbi:DNA cytosine methyltransferase [Burkholderia gladioli]|uniref:DNA cytosine methyltransferase n=1 Tax=Burkholderia gladioli TaxID=28095 RepID=UPI003FA5717D